VPPHTRESVSLTVAIYVGAAASCSTGSGRGSRLSRSVARYFPTRCGIASGCVCAEGRVNILATSKDDFQFGLRGK